MLRTLRYFGEYRDWRMIVFAGVLGIGIALVMLEIFEVYSVSSSSFSLALAAVIGAFGICLVGSMSAWRIRQKLSEQNHQLDIALNATGPAAYLDIPDNEEPAVPWPVAGAVGQSLCAT